MEEEGARKFYRLKAEFERTVEEAESGQLVEFDPKVYEPDAFNS